MTPAKLAVTIWPTKENASLIEFLAPRLSILWKDWPKNMQCTRLDTQRSGAWSKDFSLNGECPHCHKQCSFLQVTDAYRERLKDPYVFDAAHFGSTNLRLCAGMQCQGCREYILGMVLVTTPDGDMDDAVFEYEAHYPIGTPNDSAEEEIPEQIGEDFSEAIRCHWVKAYKAAVAMCGRALEASCLELGAPDIKLQDQIDWVFKQGKISASLKEIADKIKLGRNRGAHAPHDGLETIGEYEASAVIEFTREYLHHVYVMPKRMAKFDFSRSGAAKKA